MKTLTLVAMLFLLMTGCSSDDGDSIIDDLFIPNVSNQWESDRNSTFFFNPKDGKTNVNESDFTGSEQTEDDSFKLAGHFKNYDINFTFSEGPETGVKYTGKFIKGSNPLRIEVSGTNNKKIKIIQKL